MASTCQACREPVPDAQSLKRCEVCHAPFHLTCIIPEPVDILSGFICSRCSLCSLPFNHFVLDVDFNAALLSLQHDPLSPIEQLDRLLFNPLELNDDDHYLSNVDPDENFYSELPSASPCNYFLEGTFNSKCHQISCAGNMSIIHHNIRSAQRNLDTLIHYLHGLDHSFPIVCFSETWFKESNVDLFSIDGYRHTYKYRIDRDGGGVSIFSRNDLISWEAALWIFISHQQE